MMLSSVFLITFFIIIQLKNQTICSCDGQASCGCPNKSRSYPKIVGGENARTQTWSWVVSLRVRNRFQCAGTILSSSWILTAAHCFSILNHLGSNIFQIKPSDITIHAGSINQHEESQVRQVENIILHPNFAQSSFINDIALLQLSSPFHMADESLAKICLPRVFENKYPPVDSLLVAVGWGRLSENGPESSILQQVVIKTIDFDDSTCYPLVYNSSKQFCAGVENSRKDTCQGDSGGPLMVFTSSKQWVLVGITSFGFGCAQAGYSGVYTRIAAYVDWIHLSVDNTDNSAYPYSLIPSTPYEDDNLEWNSCISFRHSTSFLFSTIVSLGISFI